MRFCSKKGDDTKYAMIEFAEQESIVPALKMNNKKLGNNIIKYNKSPNLTQYLEQHKM